LTFSRRLRTLRNTLDVLGPVTTARALLAELLSPNYGDERFDRRFGTETSVMLSVIQSELPPQYRDHATGYWPAVEGVVHHILRRLPVRYEDYVFVDAGCGKGRAMLIASMYPFAAIAGIELSPLIAETARRN